jgi:RNA polymerase sigma-70 factor (ECF subfamily)
MSIWPAIAELLPELRAYGRSIAASRDDADDLVSDAIERAARSGAAPSSKRALKFWLFRVMRNLSIDAFRKARLQREYLDTHDRLFERRGPLGPDLEETLTLRTALERLRPGDRQVIVLIDVSGFSYAEAAAVLDVPIGTVMSRISRARRALIREIERPSRPSCEDLRRSGQ